VRAVAAVVGAAGAVLVLAPGASAHVSVRPTVATPGATQQFTFVVLNGRDTGIGAFRLELPPGAAVEEVTARQPAWIATSTENRVEWRGGPIPARAFDSFQVRVRMPDREGTVSFRGTELFADGPGPPYRFDVVLAGGGAIATAEATDEGARTLGKAALVVAVAALLLAAAALSPGLARGRGEARRAKP
jgi:uncharacterized protein YcnI